MTMTTNSPYAQPVAGDGAKAPEPVRLCRHAPDREPYAAIVGRRQVLRRHNETLPAFLDRVEIMRMTPLQSRQYLYRCDLVSRWLKATGDDRARLAELVEGAHWEPGQLAELIEKLSQENG